MFPFWDLVVAPLLVASKAKRIVEIGALNGDNTQLMLDRLGPDVELHVIDPVPNFDPADHETRFAGQYVFHRDLSLAALPGLPAMDAALIDGDHNWFTVLNECRLLAEVARDAGQPMPLMILHDVGWPYGRRDLYYDPSNIPDDMRQPDARRGIALHKSELVNGGMNRTLHNARHLGGPRNGVMTGLEDFIAAHDRPIRLVHLPLYYGLAIIAEHEQLATSPELAAIFDQLESADGRLAQIELGEQIRLKDKVLEENLAFARAAQLRRANDRYLNNLKSSLLGELDRDNELRLRYALTCAENGQAPFGPALRDPRRYLFKDIDTTDTLHRVGNQPDGDDSKHFPTLAMGRTRLDAIHEQLDELRAHKVLGDLVDVGVGRGGCGVFFRGYLSAYEITNRTVWSIDEFRGVRPEADAIPNPETADPSLGTDLNNVRELFHAYGLLDDQVTFVQGDPTTTIDALDIEAIALLRLGWQATEHVEMTLTRLYGAVSTGGVVIVENLPATAEAVNRFRAQHGIVDPLVTIDDSTAIWIKSGELSVDDAERTSIATRRPNVPRRIRSKPVDLSIVIVLYRMRREAARSLRALSRSYQRNLDDVNYEVLVVDNGSPAGESVTADWVASFGPEFRLLEMGDDATPSPTRALNRGAAESRGQLVGLMIDGAHIVTPGVLSGALAAQRAYGDSVVLTQQWFLGPGHQQAAVANGYDQDVEDGLLDVIEWPADGYRLFEIGHFTQDRDWFDAISESNCIFAPRSSLAQIGAFDDAFDSPGGGFANLDTFERLASSPDLTTVSLLGEGSFHQVHGGTTSNATDVTGLAQNIETYNEQYEKLRGNPFRGPVTEMRYIGSLPHNALQTRARYRTAKAFQVARSLRPGAPTEPTTIADSQRTAFIDAYWHSLAWQSTSWMGVPAPMAATDLVAYQVLLHRVQPDWIIDLTTSDRGRAFFFANLCEQIGHGRVLSIAQSDREDAPVHDRLQLLTGDAVDEAVRRQVTDIVGDRPKGFVVHGAHDRAGRTIAEFNAYRDLVSIGSYAVVERTIINGHPVWPEFGPGPTEALSVIVPENRDFMPDPDAERYGFSFHGGGFLRRHS